MVQETERKGGGRYSRKDRGRGKSQKLERVEEEKANFKTETEDP